MAMAETEEEESDTNQQSSSDSSLQSIISRHNLKARYWSYLFDNLNRAVDEIYCVCENDENINGCQEVIMTLDICKKDFNALVERIHLQTEFEVADSKPTSLAWEVRKSSPGKSFSMDGSRRSSERTSSSSSNRLSMGSARKINFDIKESDGQQNAAVEMPLAKDDSNPRLEVVHEKTTWADRVKNKGSVIREVVTTESQTKKDNDSIDNDGEWTLVHHGKSKRTRSNQQSDSVRNETDLQKLQDDYGDEDIIPFLEANDEFRNLSLADRMELLDVDSNVRPPGRVIEIHQKLSSPRKRPLDETKRIQDERQMKAAERRNYNQKERLKKVKSTLEKGKKIRQQQEEMQRQKKEYFEKKHTTAEQKRLDQLREIVRKAQEEDAKISEIAFINSLEAQNKRIEVFSRHQNHKARLKDIQTERQRKFEEQAAKEEAALERRRALEAERQFKLEELRLKKLEKEAKVELQRQERDKARSDALKEKARDREQKKSALHAALATSAKELQKRIEQKHTESNKRHEMLIEQKKEKAATSYRPMSSDYVPNVAPYECKKFCSLCKVQIMSEVYLLSHLRGKIHREALYGDNNKEFCLDDIFTESINYIVDVQSDMDEQSAHESKQRQQSWKKKAKKIKQRLNSKTKVKLVDKKALTAGNSTKTTKIIKDLEKAVKSVNDCTELNQSQCNLIEKCLRELKSILKSKISKTEVVAFKNNNGITLICKLLAMFGNQASNPVFRKYVNGFTEVVILICWDNLDACMEFILSGEVISLIDILMKRFQVINLEGKGSSEGKQKQKLSPYCPIAHNFLSLLSAIFTSLIRNDCKSVTISENVSLYQRALDCISYIVCVGIIDALKSFFGLVYNSILVDNGVLELSHECIKFLLELSSYLIERPRTIFKNKKFQDNCNLLTAFKETQFVANGPPRRASDPPKLCSRIHNLIKTSIELLNCVAVLDLDLFQSILGQEGISLEYRHVMVYLLWHFSFHKDDALLQDIIMNIGYYSILNNDNQTFIQASRSPTILQLLCALPFDYFSNPRLKDVLFPTLMALCFRNYDNKAILDQESSSSFLAEYITGYQCKNKGSEKKTEEKKDDLVSLPSRFPSSYWLEACHFFSSTAS
ncbi:S phase cyclin A-associated protein in the endoplasmic reticulum [Trichoplax sp. H2]|nr:S phase cyclin A-associated protein in the endoplasmic reticulum [Trichoplax sp. H2]|eukprot:RDD45092.1 S phase cyclin A-associated protein in the endoplasmic reticulum [Trichoplax sp. H2]